MNSTSVSTTHQIKSSTIKNLALSGLSILLMVAANASSVRAQQTAVNPAAVGHSPNYIYQINPFNLAGQAYRGYFKDQGIPSYSTLIQQYESGRITAKDLVESAIKANRLPPETLADRNYISAVDAQLADLVSDSR